MFRASARKGAEQGSRGAGGAVRQLTSFRKSATGVFIGGSSSSERERERESARESQEGGRENERHGARKGEEGMIEGKEEEEEDRSGEGGKGQGRGATGLQATRISKPHATSRHRRCNNPTPARGCGTGRLPLLSQKVAAIPSAPPNARRKRTLGISPSRANSHHARHLEHARPPPPPPPLKLGCRRGPCRASPSNP